MSFISIFRNGLSHLQRTVLQVKAVHIPSQGYVRADHTLSPKVGSGQSPRLPLLFLLAAFDSEFQDRMMSPHLVRLTKPMRSAGLGWIGKVLRQGWNGVRSGQLGMSDSTKTRLHLFCSRTWSWVQLRQLRRLNGEIFDRLSLTDRLSRIVFGAARVNVFATATEEARSHGGSES